ncbi:aminotransferase class V-fold PLP-dependent enzyme [Candidatus Micropelagos thuwalensis]
MPHFKVDVQSLGFDFFTFSGHKIFHPPVLVLLTDKVTY